MRAQSARWAVFARRTHRPPKEAIVRGERSADFSDKPSRKWTSRAVLGALAAAGLVATVVVTAGHRAPREPAGARDANSGAAQTGVSTAPSPGPENAFRAAKVARNGAAAHEPRASVAKRGDGDRTAEKKARLGDPKERERLVNVAHRELEALELQEPKYFLTVFDMMKEEERWDEKTLEAGRGETHRYILARMKILSGMLRRFIDDPESDHTLETDLLAELDDQFKTKIAALSRDVPALSNVQQLLTSTTLKAPAFADPSPEAE
jgi:hypothetical protein